jgi:hypothetical protein
MTLAWFGKKDCDLGSGVVKEEQRRSLAAS